MQHRRTVAFVYPFEGCFRNRLFEFGDTPAETHERRILFMRHLWQVARDVGIDLYTADSFLDGSVTADPAVFYFFWDWDYSHLLQRPGCVLGSWYSLEAPLHRHDRFHRLPEHARAFRRIYTVPTEKGIRGRVPDLPPGLPVRKIHFPISHDGVIESLWARKDRGPLVLINSANQSRDWGSQLYSERVRAVQYFGTRNLLDVFGPGWEHRAHPWSASWRSILSGLRHPRTGAAHLVERIRAGLLRSDLHYLLASGAIRASCRGVREGKHELLSRYTFAICYESMGMEGFVTEKIFDCLAAGTIPIYLGAPDVDRYVPRECYIDRAAFSTYCELHEYLASLNPAQIEDYREAGRRYFSSPMFQPFTKERFAERFISDALEDAATA